MKMKNTHRDFKNEQEIESQVLSGLKKENPFQVPVSYFEKLPERITEAVHLSSHKKSVFPEFRFVSHQSWVYVSGIAVLFVLMFFIFRPSPEQPTINNVVTLEQIFIEKPEWFENMTDYELIETLFVISDGELNIELETLTYDNISDDEIFNYIDKENITSDLLYNL